MGDDIRRTKVAETGEPATGGWREVTAAYRDAFGEDFPIDGSKMTYRDMFRLMRECLRCGEPYVPADLGTPGDDGD